MAKRLSDAIKKAFKKTLNNDKPVSDNQSKEITSKKRSAEEDNESVDEVADNSSNINDDPENSGSSSDAPNSPTPGPSGINMGSVPKKQKIDVINKDNLTTLFDKKTPLYENDHLEVYVVKDYLKRQKVFKLDDHLYTIKIEVKQGHPPLLISLLDILKESFEYMINTIKNFYNPGDLFFIIKVLPCNQEKKCLR